MSTFKCISCEQARELLSQGAALVDIRDEHSFSNGHIPGALSLGNHNLAAFIEQAEPDAALIVCCYHGHSSQSAAAYLAEQGFSQVFSLEGGFTLWQSLYPEQIETA